MSTPKPIHPFPARMAPHLALKAIDKLQARSTVLDPMMGSGTVVRVAANSGHLAVGRDVDPLAVLMTKVWTTPLDTWVFRETAQQLVGAARGVDPETLILPWIDNDPETLAFTRYWFAEPQLTQLRQLSSCLLPYTDAVGDALRIAMSRIIVTKDKGASLARDVSHSRPHKVAETNTYDVYAGFLSAVNRLAQRLDEAPPQGQASVLQGDARATALGAASVDAVITSPPYLNAIDYLRGHRLSLVWFGHRLSELRAIRGGSIGTERAPEREVERELVKEILGRLAIPEAFPSREQRILKRYIIDLHAMLSEVHRVLRPGGTSVFVVGNSCVKGVYIWNSRIISHLLTHLGFRHESHSSRALPDAHRYLPPPTEGSDLERRMRREVCLTYTRL